MTALAVAASAFQPQPAFKSNSSIQQLQAEQASMATCPRCTTPSMTAAAQKAARATACLFSSNALTYDKVSRTYSINRQNNTYSHAVVISPAGVKRLLPLEEHTPFRGQSAAGNSTCFVVSRKTVMTAGHCLYRTNPDGTRTPDLTQKIVFGYKMNGKNPVSRFLEERVYSIKNTWHEHPYNDVGTFDAEQPDWAWVELDRDITGIEPLECTEKDVVNQEVFMNGHPCGMGLKHVHGMAKSPEDEYGYFPCDITSFGGNSGSPIMDLSGRVVGILCNAIPHWEESPTNPGHAREKVYDSTSPLQYPGCFKISRTMFSIAHKINRCGLFTEIDKIAVADSKMCKTKNKHIAELEEIASTGKAKLLAIQGDMERAEAFIKGYESRVFHCACAVNIAILLGNTNAPLYKAAKANRKPLQKRLDDTVAEVKKTKDTKEAEIEKFSYDYEKMVSGTDDKSLIALNEIAFGCEYAKAKKIMEFSQQFQKNFKRWYSQLAVETLLKT